VANRATRQTEGAEEQDGDDRGDRDVFKRPYSIACHGSPSYCRGHSHEHDDEAQRTKLHNGLDDALSPIASSSPPRRQPEIGKTA
jgi:hypothetical protein